MDLSKITEISIVGVKMESLSSNGVQIWSGFPKELYIIKDGRNELGLEWDAVQKPSTLSESAFGYEFNKDGVLDMYIRVGNNQQYSFQLTSKTAAVRKAEKYTKLHVSYSNKHCGNQYRNIDFYLGDSSYRIRNTAKNERIEGTEVFDLSGLSGELTFAIDYHDHDAASGAWGTSHFYVKDVWLSAE